MFKEFVLTAAAAALADIFDPFSSTARAVFKATSAVGAISDVGARVTIDPTIIAAEKRLVQTAQKRPIKSGKPS